MRYTLDEKPGTWPLVLYGLQWWIVALPSIVILGLVSARLHGAGLEEHIWYMRKLFWLMGAASAVQVLWGHRLPLVAGPASTLLVGLIASSADGVNATYSAILIGGTLLALAAGCGLLSRLRFFFTPRIVAVILVLIALTLMPTMLRLILPGPDHALFHICFAVLTVFALIMTNTFLPGTWKSLTLPTGLLGGCLIYALGPGFVLPVTGEEGRYALFISALDVRLGPLLAFVFCFLALTINELGSIESIGHMLQADAMEGRIRRGAGIQGVTNMVAGALGVIGPVDYSLSAGLISATGCASRYTLLPMAAGLAVCGFFPSAIRLLTAIPSPVMGALMLYLMSAQLATGLGMLTGERGIRDFNSGMTVGFPLMLGLLIAFAPASAFDGFPEPLRPILSNGFVMGAISVIILEHFVFRKKANA